MKRERALKIVLVLVGLLFCAAVYPLVLMAKQDPALAMMMSLYATLGVFLLVASRNPSAHRSLIAFTAWSSFAHATVMGVQAFLSFIARRELLGVATFIADRRSTDRSSSGKTYETANREGIGGCVGCSVALPASYPAAAPILMRASRVLPSTPPLFHRVERHFFDGQFGGFPVSGIHRCPQTSQTATRILVQPMPHPIILCPKDSLSLTSRGEPR